MNSTPGTAREAAERNARAVMDGDLTQVMADISPDAMAKLMQMGAEAQATGVPNPTTMPSIESYEIADVDEAGDGSSFDVTFRSAMGTATVRTTWAQIVGQWKIVDVRLLRAEFTPGTPGS